LKHLYLGTSKDNRRDFMERNPKAKTLMKQLHKRGKIAIKNFWDGLSKTEREEFIKRRNKIQTLKYPKGCQSRKQQGEKMKEFWRARTTHGQ